MVRGRVLRLALIHTTAVMAARTVCFASMLARGVTEEIIDSHRGLT